MQDSDLRAEALLLLWGIPENSEDRLGSRVVVLAATCW